MPSLYASGKLKVVFNLDREEDSWTIDEWTSSENKTICEDYGHPYIKIVYIIDNPEDPSEPWMFHVSEKDAYEGDITCEQSGNTFVFKADGKFNFNVHKDIPAQIESGKEVRFEGISYLREEHSASYTVEENTFQFSKKKF